VLLRHVESLHDRLKNRFARRTEFLGGRPQGHGALEDGIEVEGGADVSSDVVQVSRIDAPTYRRTITLMRARGEGRDGLSDFTVINARRNTPVIGLLDCSLDRYDAESSRNLTDAVVLGACQTPVIESDIEVIVVATGRREHGPNLVQKSPLTSRTRPTEFAQGTSPRRRTSVIDVDMRTFSRSRRGRRS
jgi:hypothetical protein